MRYSENAIILGSFRGFFIKNISYINAMKEKRQDENEQTSVFPSM